MQAMTAQWRTGGMAPFILNFECRWSWVASLRPPSLSHRWISPRYLLNTRLNGPQWRS